MMALATILLPITAFACWRWSRLVADALLLALAAEVVYDVAPWEPLRLVSAVTGLAGVVVLIEHGRQPLYIVGHGRNWRLGFWQGLAQSRPTVLAFLLVGSMAADAAALLWWRGTGEWGPLPFFQVVVLLAMIGVSLWPRRST